MLSFTIIPNLGIRDNVPPDDPSMFEFITDSIARTYCADSEFVSYNNTYVGRSGAANKTGGRTQLLSYAVAVASGTATCCAFFQSRSAVGILTNYFGVTNSLDSGRLYTWASGDSAMALCSDGAGNEEQLFDSTYPLCNELKIGDYILIPELGAAPKCIKGGSRVVTTAEPTTSLTYCYFMEKFTNRIFAANTDNGEYSIQYSNLNPTLPDYDTSVDSTLSFAVANELFYPDKEGITGIKQLDKDRLTVFSNSSISEIRYSANFSSPYSIHKLRDGIGCLAQDSIVTMEGVHFFFSRDSGFCAFDGVNVKIISESIKDTVDLIVPLYVNATTTIRLYSVPGALLKTSKEIAWSISTNGSYNTYILYYNYVTGQWRKDPTYARIIKSGYKLGDDVNEVLLLANTKTVYYGGLNASDNGSDYIAYREEPILNFGGMRKSLILEFWVNSDRNLSSGYINIYYRGGNSIGEIENLTWTLAAILTYPSPSPPIAKIRNTINLNNRYHQIKWGNIGSSDLFTVREIQIKYVLQGMY